jgi:putative oxidoreductase
MPRADAGQAGRSRPHKSGRGKMATLYGSFDLNNEFNILRIACGVFLLPHFYAKASNLPRAYELYRDFRLYPPQAWVFTAITIEIVASIGLVFDLYVRYAALLACAFLLAAAVTIWRYSKGKWLWNIGGCEYCLFWAICCLVLAMHG